MKIEEFLPRVISLFSSHLPLFCRCTQIKMYSWENAQVILVGNKCDMDEIRYIAELINLMDVKT